MVPRTVSLRARALPLAAPDAQRALLARVPVEPFEVRVDRSGGAPLVTARPTVLQLNLGKLCNQTCRHCHVDAGPDRDEVMSDAVLEAALDLLARAAIPALDLTGGAPELHPRFREIVARARATGAHVMDRSNLTILRVPRFHDLPAFLAAHGVEVVASLPWYSSARTDAQRGEGVFAGSIDALRGLNALGYGAPGSGLVLTLVTNPAGTYLSPPQGPLERDWHRELERLWGVRFTRLFTIQNMPISRFLEVLEERGQTADYVTRLAGAFNPAALGRLMCRTTLSVGWDGRLYDCDFNQMLELATPATIFDVRPDALAGRPIRTGAHCYGCTAGAGSSCGGALA